METVEEVEFAGNLVSDTSRDSLSIECFVDLNSGVKGPGRFSMVKICDTTNIAARISFTIGARILYENILVQTDVDIQAVYYTRKKVRLLPLQDACGEILTVLRFETNHCLSSSPPHRRHLVVEKTAHLH